MLSQKFRCSCSGFSHDRAAWEWEWADSGEDCGTSDPDRNKLNFDALLIIVVKHCTHITVAYYILTSRVPCQNQVSCAQGLTPFTHTHWTWSSKSWTMTNTLAKCNLATFHTCVCRVLRHCPTATSGFNLIHQYLHAVADNGELLIRLYFSGPVYCEKRLDSLAGRQVRLHVSASME